MDKHLCGCTQVIYYLLSYTQVSRFNVHSHLRHEDSLGGEHEI